MTCADEVVGKGKVDRERGRQVAADIGRILERVNELQARAAAAGAVEPVDGVVVPRWEGCPYRGLLPFEEADAAVFYGRRSATARLLERLAEQSAVGPATG
ncbi:hypothetical protein [Micromonospora sp. NBC_01638]|uniref:nSTAND1 domain-containing NTPase n=1 Tax=Micromonospora sp. NBC_01638 TaxID=2975982 RepID=UPI00386368E0|nr:hypothetical protein OG811_23255 [Micromonospora sp. NBC_01638]